MRPPRHSERRPPTGYRRVELLQAHRTRDVALAVRDQILRGQKAGQGRKRGAVDMDQAIRQRGQFRRVGLIALENKQIVPAHQGDPGERLRGIIRRAGSFAFAGRCQLKAAMAPVES